jgi:hypothetical protein
MWLGFAYLEQGSAAKAKLADNQIVDEAICYRF